MVDGKNKKVKKLTTPIAHPLFTISLSLFLLMDPIGNIPIYVSVLKNLPPNRQRYIIIREKLIALAVILFFYFAGKYFLLYLNISPSTVQIAGGIILFLISLKMIFPRESKVYDEDAQEDPLIVPLAIPLIAGPSVLAAVMLYSRQELNWRINILAICIAWLVSTCILILSPNLKRFLGKRGLSALERLMGLILTLIAIQMFLEGLHSYLPHINN